MLTVRHAGVLSSLQDAGRQGVQALGVTPGGAVDDLALHIGNLIVGNAADALAIEMTWQGMDLEFSEDTLIALTGAPLLERNTQQPLPSWRPLWVRAGARLLLGRMPQGARSYLCVQGGVQIAKVLGGAGVDLRNGFGGDNGRALQAGDTLPVATQEKRYADLQATLLRSSADWVAPAWQVSVWRDWWLPHQRPLPVLVDKNTGGVVAGDGNACNVVDTTLRPAIQTLVAKAFKVLPHSDRQGLRLQGPPLSVVTSRRRSAGVCFGLIQLPPDGRPIVLLADHQTTGGYPVLGVVASVARSALAQTRPGDMLRFAPVTLAQMHAALWQREQRLHYVRKQLHWRMQTAG